MHMHVHAIPNSHGNPRGEIALRIIRTCKEMGIKTVARFNSLRFS